MRARSLAAPGPGEAGGGGQGEVTEPPGGRGRHGDRRTEGAAQRLGERAGAPGEVNGGNRWRGVLLPVVFGIEEMTALFKRCT